MPDPAALSAVITMSPLGKTLAVIGTAAASYLSGSICFAILFTYLFIKEDIRGIGSGNAGTANVLRSVGWLAGALTGIFDFLKGVFSVQIGYFLFASAGFDAYTGGCFAALFSLLGHLYPVYFSFRGGKGVMTAAGIVLVLHLRLFLVLITVYIVSLLIWKMTSLSGLITAGALPLGNALFGIIEGHPWFFPSLYFVLIALLIFWTHRENIQRIKNKTERKLTVRIW